MSGACPCPARKQALRQAGRRTQACPRSARALPLHHRALCSPLVHPPLQRFLLLLLVALCIIQPLTPSASSTSISTQSSVMSEDNAAPMDVTNGSDAAPSQPNPAEAAAKSVSGAAQRSIATPIYTAIIPTTHLSHTLLLHHCRTRPLACTLATSLTR